MQIKRLKLAGFKSFVEPAELRIEPGLTGVVGPNGCGKSNVLEAIRWVMGESSPKSMRGTPKSPARSAASGSTSSETSANSRAGRIAVPAKMTSSMPAPRIDLGELSPITQRIASSTFDLPQPFGPTTPVRPGSIRSSAGSTKLLNPESLRRLTRN